MANPYPTNEEKDELLSQCGLTLQQVKDWFAEVRRKNKAAIRAARTRAATSLEPAAKRSRKDASDDEEDQDDDDDEEDDEDEEDEQEQETLGRSGSSKRVRSASESASQ